MVVPKKVNELLARFSPEARALALRVRELVLEVVPDAIEQVDFSAKIISYGVGLKYADVVCVIMPQTSWVKLGFAGGGWLPDPTGLLEGTGKRHRHVKLRTDTDVDVEAPALRALLKAAVVVKTSDLAAGSSLERGANMPVTVKHITLWRAEVENKPGVLGLLRHNSSPWPAKPLPIAAAESSRHLPSLQASEPVPRRTGPRFTDERLAEATRSVHAPGGRALSPLFD